MQQGNIPQEVYNVSNQLPPVRGNNSPTEGRKFKTEETIFAWISIVFGYLFCRAVPVSINPLGGLICFLLLFGVTFCMVYKKGKSISGLEWFSAISAILVLSILFFSASSTFKNLSFCYAIAAYCHFVMVAFGGGVGGTHPEFLFADYIKALFIMPFASFGVIFPALGGAKEKRWGNSAIKILCGLAAALIPTAIIISLLSYDNDFVDLLGQIFSFDIGDIFSHIFSATFGVVVGMYLFGLYYSSGNGKCKSVITAKSCSKAVSSLRFAPSLVLISATLPILAVYVIFFLSQWKYYVSGFMGVLPQEFSYANYAREGFFQLLSVSIINFALIAAITLFWKRKNKSTPALLRVLSVVFAICTLILVGTAMAKLVMYIDAYGLTPKRVYAAWFMVVLVILFVLICVKQFIKRFKFAPASLICVVAMFTILGISGSDTLIAEYNVDRYLSGKLETVDVTAMEELGDAAIPALIHLATEMNKGSAHTLSEEILGMDDYSLSVEENDFYSASLIVIGRAAGEYEHNIFAVTLPSIRAKNALRSLDIPLGKDYYEAKSEQNFEEFEEEVEYY